VDESESEVVKVTHVHLRHVDIDVVGPLRLLQILSIGLHQVLSIGLLQSGIRSREEVSGVGERDEAVVAILVSSRF
jgi:hypothetical protein